MSVTLSLKLLASNRTRRLQSADLNKTLLFQINLFEAPSNVILKLSLQKEGEGMMEEACIWNETGEGRKAY